MVHIAVNGSEVRATCDRHRKKCVNLLKCHLSVPTLKIFEAIFQRNFRINRFNSWYIQKQINFFYLISDLIRTVAE